MTRYELSKDLGFKFTSASYIEMSVFAMLLPVFLLLLLLLSPSSPESMLLALTFLLLFGYVELNYIK